MGLTEENAFFIFTLDFESAASRYTDEYIKKIFDMVYTTNATKYKKLVSVVQAEYNPIDNYNMTESSTDTRSPDLTHMLTLNTTSAMTDTRKTDTTGSSTTTTNTKINQIRTTQETPENMSETTTHSVNPFDNTGSATDYEDTTTQSGSRKVEESYSGDADTQDQSVAGTSTTTNSGGTTTTQSGSNTQTETGTDTTDHTLTRKGNIGVTTSQQMLEAELKLAEKMNIFKIIEQDLAAKVFLQVWL